MIFDDIQKVYELAIAYIGNGRYFAFAMAALLFLFVTSKKIRPRLIYPTLLIIIISGTPWLYHYVFNRDAYWRTFWMFPGAILIALFCVRLIQACENVGERIGMTVFLFLLLFFMGTNMYSAQRTRPDGSKEYILNEATNPEKVTTGTKRVADILLSIEENPKVVSRKKYVYELRQYSSKIKLYYGRDIDGFIIPVPKKKGWRTEVHKQLESSSPNYYRILYVADESGYNFVITSSTYRINEDILDKYGYREIAILDGSAIYYKEHPKGIVSEEDEENEGPDISSDTAISDTESAAMSEPEIQTADDSGQDTQSADESGQNTQTADGTGQNTQTAAGTGQNTQSPVNTGGSDEAVQTERTESENTGEGSSAANGADVAGRELLEQFAANS